MRYGTKVVAKVLLVVDDAVCARPGDLGTVVCDEEFPTVRFDRTGRATIVDPMHEIEEINGVGRFVALGELLC